ncbi:hypothetical protein L1987_55680 [Smallanthus sonchifolius]|uniref:Uncharacterized protein n=1 Tax=Smallanthus sonchifolius TaxID=185202 RepID=A0ACB9EAX9_9ASTR|nr:hypothetical protein L1987_55680 [Smallanthus sonchifolius]
MIIFMSCKAVMAPVIAPTQAPRTSPVSVAEEEEEYREQRCNRASDESHESSVEEKLELRMSHWRRVELGLKKREVGIYRRENRGECINGGTEKAT